MFRSNNGGNHFIKSLSVHRCHVCLVVVVGFWKALYRKTDV